MVEFKKQGTVKSSSSSYQAVGLLVRVWFEGFDCTMLFSVLPVCFPRLGSGPKLPFSCV